MADSAWRRTPFGFPSEPQVEPPSARLQRIQNMRLVSGWLTAAVAAAFALNILLTLWMLSVVDAEAYVADGGLFGCRVPVLSLEGAQ